MDRDRTSIEAVAHAMIDDAAHYVRAVAAMAGSHTITAAVDIVDADGSRVVAAGTPIDPDLCERLAGHLVSVTAIERSLQFADDFTADALAFDYARVIDEDPWCACIASECGGVELMRAAIGRLRLPREIRFRLAVVRDQRESLYRHSLRVAVIGHYLALRSRLKPPVIDCVLVAALCHDLGELLTDPAILEPGHRVTDAERQYIYVHPVTGWLMVHALPEIHDSTAKAILQHQERLDGSGYPYGIKDEAIGMVTRILAAADIAETILARYGEHRRLSTLLRLNQRKYDRNIVGLLHQVVAPEGEAAAPVERSALVRRQAGFASVLDGWSRLRAEKAIAKAPPGVFLSERMFNLRMVVVQFGFDPDSLEVPVGLAGEDSSIAAELSAVIDEVQFQLADLGREYDRRAGEWQGTVDPHATQALADWRQQLQACIEA